MLPSSAQACKHHSLLSACMAGSSRSSHSCDELLLAVLNILQSCSWPAEDSRDSADFKPQICLLEKQRLESLFPDIHIIAYSNQTDYCQYDKQCLKGRAEVPSRAPEARRMLLLKTMQWPSSAPAESTGSQMRKMLDSKGKTHSVWVTTRLHWTDTQTAQTVRYCCRRRHTMTAVHTCFRRDRGDEIGKKLPELPESFVLTLYICC